MRLNLIVVFSVLYISSCAEHPVTNSNHKNFVFSNVESDFEVTDINKYTCERIGASIIKHVLKTGTLVTRRDIHDYYSTTGCSIKGAMLVNGEKTSFTFDYGGVIYFENELLLGCGRECCSDGFPYCSWETPENTK